MFSAERPLGEIFEAAGKPFELGDAVRALDIPVPAPGEGGIFDKIPKSYRGSSADLAAQVVDMISRNHGVLTPWWINQLSGASVQEVRAAVEVLETEFLKRVAITDPVLLRVA